MQIQDLVKPLWHKQLHEHVSTPKKAERAGINASRVAAAAADAAALHASRSVARALASQSVNEAEKMRLFIDGNLAVRVDPTGAIAEVGILTRHYM